MQQRKPYEKPELSEVGMFSGLTQGLGSLYLDFFGISADPGYALIL